MNPDAEMVAGLVRQLGFAAFNARNDGEIVDAASIDRAAALIESQSSRIAELEGRNELLRESNDTLRVDLAAAREALEQIMHARRNPDVANTDMSRAGMRELAYETLEHIRKQTESVDFCIRNGASDAAQGGQP